jgi:hypothetical protein
VLTPMVMPVARSWLRARSVHGSAPSRWKASHRAELQADGACALATAQVLAAQLLSVQLLDAGVNAAVVGLGALVGNARMLFYSASLAPHTSARPGTTPVAAPIPRRCGTRPHRGTPGLRSPVPCATVHG